MFTTYIPKDVHLLNYALPLLGWRNSIRLTTENRACLVPICRRAVGLNRINKLTSKEIDSMSLKVYAIIDEQVMGIREVAECLSLVYDNSKYLRPLLPMIDEAMMCFYSGYHTAALALLFVTLESYLRLVSGWKPGDKDPKFKELQKAVLALSSKEDAVKAYEILKVIYSRYEATTPTQFYFNRHGLLHGVRGRTKHDKMNCARIIQLFNLVCVAEGVDGNELGTSPEMQTRCAKFLDCLESR